MASLVKYDTTEEYFRVQVRANQRKFKRISTTQEEVVCVADWLLRHNRGKDSFGICHGARNGWEVNEFAMATCHEVYGTDIAPVDSTNMVQWDFHHPRIEWHGNVDWIYSNALDHAWCPRVALFTWFESLASDGVLFLPWHKGKMKGRRTDPFAATLMEYMQMVNEFGGLLDDVPLDIAGYKVRLLIGGRKR